MRWSGRPPSGLLLRGSDLWFIPFSLLWGGFAIFWESMAVQQIYRGGWFMVAWGLPFVGVGLYMVVGRFFWDAYVRSRTTYAVTDHAAYVVTEGIGGAVRRYTGSVLDDVRIERRSDGSGTLRFGPDQSSGLWNRRNSVPTTTPPNAFEHIPDVEAAYDAVLAARA